MLLVTALRAMRASDWPDVERIYGQGIADGEATFETATPTWEAFDASRLSFGRLVALDDAAAVVGWVAASPVSAREAYRGVVEHSVYIARDARGRGIGRLLLDAFIDATEREEVWTIQSSIFPENAASARLHELCGCRVVGHRERIARTGVGPRAGEWRNTLLIERRSRKVGADARDVDR
ncbi:GNAT family N-acetyltransferase [Microbacterium sp. RU33B]|uniref:GNAT family N-acetyltransferase n=1 Tax=Microbacterium sp. RU33B TaxID=1907390 RepID=UPI00095D59B3|nr:GNAT family N-acetyltransferase [Microbacterium sp. RU33B]SIT69287.1 phosphinothricin acetyltransferase [Microbacterium sp. RU33B]